MGEPHRDFGLRVGAFGDAWTWYSSSLASCGTSALMQLNTASTGPLPSASSI
jgi:hypothetical protein